MPLFSHTHLWHEVGMLEVSDLEDSALFISVGAKWCGVCRVVWCGVCRFFCRCFCSAIITCVHTLSVFLTAGSGRNSSGWNAQSQARLAIHRSTKMKHVEPILHYISCHYPPVRMARRTVPSETPTLERVEKWLEIRRWASCILANHS